MNKRISEEFRAVPALAPQSLAAGTAKQGEFLDMSGVMEAAILVSCAALGAGKALTVELVAAPSADGTGAAAIAGKTFTDAGGTGPRTAVVTYRPTAEHGRYAAVKVSHNAAAAVVCGATALIRPAMEAVENAWALNT